MTLKLYLSKRSNGYYYIGWFEGNSRKWRTTKCTVKSEALSFLKSFKSETEKKVEPLRLSKFTELFRTRVNGSIRKSTLRPYLMSLKSFETVIGDKLLSEYTVHDIENYKQKRLETISPVTLNIELRSLKSTFNSAVKWEFLKETPFRKVSLLTVPQISPTYLSKEDIKKLMGTVKELCCPLRPYRQLLKLVGEAHILSTDETHNRATIQSQRNVGSVDKFAYKCCRKEGLGESPTVDTFD